MYSSYCYWHLASLSFYLSICTTRRILNTGISLHYSLSFYRLVIFIYIDRTFTLPASGSACLLDTEKSEVRIIIVSKKILYINIY